MDSSHVLTAHPHFSSPASPDRLARPVAAQYPLPSPRWNALLWLLISGFLLFILSRIPGRQLNAYQNSLGMIYEWFHGSLSLGEPAVVRGPPGQCQGQSTSRKGLPGKRGGKEERSSLVEYGGSPQGNPQQMQWIMKKYNAVWQAVYLTKNRVSEWGVRRSDRLTGSGCSQPLQGRAGSCPQAALSPSSSACGHSRHLQPCPAELPFSWIWESWGLIHGSSAAVTLTACFPW